VRHGGMRLSLAVVSRKLARLEERLGVRLVNCTTRTLALTEEGASFHARCVRILADVEEAEMAMTSARQTASGILRATSTVAFGRRRLAPLLREFQLLHPDLQVHLDATDAVVNIIEGGYDLAIRFGGAGRHQPDRALAGPECPRHLRGSRLSRPARLRRLRRSAPGPLEFCWRADHSRTQFAELQ
jgi:DNA-binding transcriptional LysR family regulator